MRHQIPISSRPGVSGCVCSPNDAITRPHHHSSFPESKYVCTATRTEFRAIVNIHVAADLRLGLESKLKTSCRGTTTYKTRQSMQFLALIAILIGTAFHTPLPRLEGFKVRGDNKTDYLFLESAISESHSLELLITHRRRPPEFSVES